MSLREYLGFLRRAWGLFRGARKTWRLPPRARLLIIDRNTAYPLDEIFAHHSPHIMDIRGESINLAVVVRALPKFRLGALAYLEAYIDAVAPVLVLSRTDNNPMLWQLKRRPSVAYTVALVQNGRRLDLESSLPAVLDPWGPHGVWRVDRAFTLGPTWASQLQRRFSSAVVAAGSIMANMFPSTRGITAAVVLVSTFRPEYPRRGLDLGESLYEGLGAYMRRHQLHLNVAGFAGPDGRGEEIAFLSARLPDGLWSLRSRESNWSSYETLLTAGTVIVDQSTLGYEALVLGKRVGFVGAMEWCRETHRFGKPLEFGEKGPFWTNEPSEAEIERILDYLLSVSDEHWEKDSGWIRDQLIVHDYGNTILKRYVEGVLAGKGDVLAEEAGGGRG